MYRFKSVQKSVHENSIICFKYYFLLSWEILFRNFKNHPGTDKLAEHRIPGAPGSLISEGKHGFLVGCFWAKVPQLPDHGFRPPGGVGQKFRYGSVQKWSGAQLGLPGGSDPSRDQTVDFGSKIMILERDFEIWPNSVSPGVTRKNGRRKNIFS